MTVGTPLTVRRLMAVDAAVRPGLVALVRDCVDGGASIGFMHPVDDAKAQAYWDGAAASLARGDRALLVAEDAAGIAGSVQLLLAMPENQPHRADLAKMMVHRRARRLGVGAALLQAAEALAVELGRTLLVLDTGTPEAARLYARHGWVACGTVPGYALMPGGGPCDTTFYYRVLGPLPAAAPGTAGP